ncbi:alpha/beta fold hydrolase [Kaistia defluvii]|uniref:alpha/beta fold hydrolase n=1 Tax=Kaistia defluvii TaxID=410841 RepID=UPI00224E477A|nr:alpha/beta fold hydrolase [Kaistia defluvii]MCX5517883.1 alpha/beta fold hydrolase [Kaistia defluvii]
MAETNKAAAVAVPHRLGGSDGRPEVVFVHGFGSDRLAWLANAPALAGAFKVWGVDLPGHGDAEPGQDNSLDGLADAVLAGLAPHLTGKVHLVGHSLGGALALRLAHRAPDRVRSIVLIAPAGLGRGIDGDFTAGLARLEEPDPALALLQRLVARPRLINKAMALHVLAHLDRPGRRQALSALAENLPAIEEMVQPAIAAIRQGDLPRMVIWGENDAINPLDPERLANFGGERHIVPGAGHLPQIEEITRVNGWIQGFLTAHS